jgi:hypothetical protein
MVWASPFFLYIKKHLILHFYILLYNSLISLPPPHPPTSGLDEKYSPVTAINDDDDEELL